MEHLEFRKKWEPVAEAAEREILAQISRLPDAEFRALRLSKLAGKLTPDGLQKFREIERSRVLQTQRRPHKIREYLFVFIALALISAAFIFYYNENDTIETAQSRIGKTVTPVTNVTAVIGFESLADARDNNVVSGHIVMLKKGAKFYVLKDLGDVLEVSDRPLTSKTGGNNKWVSSRLLK